MRTSVFKYIYFIHFVATNDGGVFSIQIDVELTVINSFFTGNSAKFEGGVFSLSDASCNITSSIFTSNVATEGAVIYIIDSKLFIQESSFHNNGALSTTLQGGVFSCHSLTHVHSSNSLYIGNIASEGGVAILSSCSWQSWNDSVIANHALRGGLISGQLRSNVSIQYMLAEGNEATSSYGALIAMVHGSFLLENSQILKNHRGQNSQSTSALGTIALSGVSIQIKNNVFSGNNAHVGGGALLLYRLDSSQDLEVLSLVDTAVIEGNSFIENVAGNEGGAIYIDDYGQSVSIVNCRFINNSAAYGGAIRSGSTEVFIANSQFVNNTALNGGGAIFWIYSKDGKVNVGSECEDVGNSASFGNFTATNVVALDVRTADSSGISGSLTSAPIFVNMIDYYSQIVTNSTNTISSVPYVYAFAQNSSYGIRGVTVVEAIRGVATYDDLIITGYPSKNVTLKFFLSGTDVPAAYLAISMIDCVPGQIFVYQSDFEAVCFNCTAGSYSLSTTDPTCYPCPSNSFCPGGNTINVEPGYWRLSSTSSSIYECPVPSSCLGGSNVSEQCATGHYMYLCDVCRPGYSRDASGGCLQCTNNSILLTSIVTPIFLFFVVSIVVIVVLFRKKLRQLFTSLSVMVTNNTKSIKFRSVRVKFKILIAFYQITSQIGPSTSIAYPAVFANYLSALSFLNFSFDEFSDFRCVVNPSFYASVIVNTLVPIVFWFVFVFVQIIRVLYAERLNKLHPSYTREQARENAISAALYISYVALSPVSTKLFELFGCTSFSDGTSYLISDLSVSCQTHTYQRMVIYGIIFLFIYPIGIPLVYATLLITNRKLINPTWRLVVDDREHNLMSEKLLQRDKIKIRETYPQIKNISFLFDNCKSLNSYEIVSYICYLRRSQTETMVF